MKQYKIVIDTKGSDRGAGMMIKGASLALQKYPELAVLLVGDTDVMLAECEKNGMPMDRVELLEAPETITNYDSPAEALFVKRDSSLVKALEALSERDDLVGLINAGSTGALIAGSMRYLSGKDRVRPALAAVLPAANGGFTCLVDTGATIDCPASTLVHFARLGRDFMKNLYRIENPRIGLLSNGAEPTKGNKLVKETHALLRDAEDINFVGNIEGNKALSGECDVLVCDGFAGNQVLKVTEGAATRIITDIVKYSKKTGDESLMKLVGYLMGIYDFNSLGGGVILGTVKPVIKAHGAANEQSIVSTAGIILNLAENKELFDKSAFDIKE
ncbi:MAG: phosphate--acyl-ACP acyltransferase [Clostridia bacterium]|nr:phosphate--acyl-ACP acyltransferase [Clostridia bacterium]